MAIADYVANIKLKTDTATNSLDGLDSRIKQTGSKASGVFGRMGKSLDKLRLPLLAFGTGAYMAFNKLSDGATDLSESINAVNVTFGDYSKDILKYSKDAKNAIGLSQEEFNSIAIRIRPQLENAGFSGDELNKEIVGLVERAADVGSIMNMDTGAVLQKFLAALRGEADPIESLGVIINEGALAQEAMALGIEKSTKNMTQQEKIALRLKGILRQTEKMQGDFANTSHEGANAAKINTARLKDQQDRLGMMLSPLKKLEGQIKSGLISAFENLSDEQIKFVGKVGLLTTGVTAAAVVLASLPLILKGVAAGIRLIGLSNPVFLAITAAAVLIINYWEEVSSFFKGFAKGFSVAFSPVIEKFKSLEPIFSAIGGGFKWLGEKIFGAEGDLGKFGAAGERVGAAVATAIEFMLSPFDALSKSIRATIDLINVGIDKVLELTGLRDAEDKKRREKETPALRQNFGGNFPGARAIQSAQQMDIANRESAIDALNQRSLQGYQSRAASYNTTVVNNNNIRSTDPYAAGREIGRNTASQVQSTLQEPQ